MKLRYLSRIVAALLIVGCLLPMAPANAGLVDNGLFDNGLLDNGLINNGLLNNGLIDNGLLDNGLLDNGIEYDAAVYLTARGTATIGEKTVPISVKLAALISEVSEGVYRGPALLVLQIVGSEKQGEVLKAVTIFSNNVEGRLGVVMIGDNPVLFIDYTEDATLVTNQIIALKDRDIKLDLVWVLQLCNNEIIESVFRF